MAQVIQFEERAVARLGERLGAADAAEIKTKMEASTFGTEVGRFWADAPAEGNGGTGRYYDLTVHYTQPTSLFLFPGPTITIARTKRVWTAAAE